MAPTGVEPPIGIGYGAAPESRAVGQRLAGDLELAPVALAGAGVVHLRAEQQRQQLVADRRRRPVAGQHEMNVEPEHRSGGCGHAAMVGLRRAHRHERPCARGERRAAQELQLAGLVAAHAEPVRSSRLTHNRTPPGSSGRARVESAALPAARDRVRRTPSHATRRHSRRPVLHPAWATMVRHMATTDWNPTLRGEFDKPYWRDLQQFVTVEREQHVVYPPHPAGVHRAAPHAVCRHAGDDPRPGSVPRPASGARFVFLGARRRGDPSLAGQHPS